MATVAKPFNSHHRRFRVGAEVNESDDLAPHNFDDLKARGFLSEPSDRRAVWPSKVADASSTAAD